MRTTTYSGVLTSLLVVGVVIAFTAVPAIATAQERNMAYKGSFGGQPSGMYGDAWGVAAGEGAYRPVPYGPYDYAYRGSNYAPWSGFSAGYGAGYYPSGSYGIRGGIGVITPDAPGFGSQ